MTEEWEFWIDTGGTFTDCLGRSPDGTFHRAKVLSSSSLRATIKEMDTRSVTLNLAEMYPQNFFNGFRLRLPSINSTVLVESYDPDLRKLELKEDLPLGVTVGDLVVLEFTGEAPELGARVITGIAGDEALPKSRLRLATTKSTNALLEGKGEKTVFFINKGLGDLFRINNQQRPDLFALDIKRPDPIYETVIEVEIDLGTGLPNTGEITEQVKALLDQGISTAAVCLINSFRDDRGERSLVQFLKNLGVFTVIPSSECAPFIKILPRAETTLVDAYLTPVLDSYLSRIATQFRGDGLSVMTSAGGLVPHTHFRAKDSLFSGPAGGVVGAVSSGEQAGYSKLIGFDMGGTSTDVARYNGALAYQFETRVGHARVMAPSLKIETVAAGGGSICMFDGERLRVGPESAGAEPGPACYGTGGPLTITDVNLLLGRMDPDQFGIPIDLTQSEDQLQALQLSIQLERGGNATDQLLGGLLEIANENMTDAIRKISSGEGYDPRDYALVAFGGAGGQHACGIAEKLGISTILFPGDAGLLSAAGLSKAVLEGFVERQILCSFDEFYKQAESLTAELEGEALHKLNPGDREFARLSRRIVSLRLSGHETPIDIDWLSDTSPLELFLERYNSIFGYRPSLDQVEVVCYRVVVATPRAENSNEEFPENSDPGSPTKKQRAFSSGKWREASVYVRENLGVGSKVKGPAIIQDSFSTLFVDAGWETSLGTQGTIRLSTTEAVRSHAANSKEIEIELFSNRFQSLVEEMGLRLMRTAVSTNVKDRLDFSCGLLDADGCLVVNAPHIPVHLGAMGMCVRTISETHNWQAGEMLVTNHPGMGGSHLPDMTVICPIFSDTNILMGFLVNRAHHAEMGGIAPGSMPPAARSLAEEGVVIPPTVVMHGGEVNLRPIERLLREGPYPSRRVGENLSDLKAQIAANKKGLQDFENLVREKGGAVVCEYMSAIQDRAEKSLRCKLGGFPDGSYEALQKLDDGTTLKVVATVSGETMTFSFNDGGGVHPGNFNATPGIVYSAVIYFLRVWLNEPMPLNEGLLRPVKIEIAEGLLNPPFDEDPFKSPPVVAGNVETSQRLVDTLLLAFEVVACSQGTMNNLIFGNERISFYETIAGGAGAGEGYNGASAVHVHMTNTGTTDPELLEYRFPVKLKEFSIRKNSGGQGQFSGGDGIIRELEFTEPVTLSLLTQHRVEAPYGLAGGSPGKTGEQWLIRPGLPPEKLAPTDRVEIQVGDRIRILTPGGGGWGTA